MQRVPPTFFSKPQIRNHCFRHRQLQTPNWILGVVLGLTGMLIGCSDKPAATSEAALPYQGQTIRIVAPQGWGFKDQWDVQLQEWSARTGAQAELAESDMRDGSGPLLKSGEPAQLIIFPWTRRGELLADKQLQSLPKDALVESQLHWDDLFRGLRERQGQSESGPTLVPLGAPVLACYYRQDLLEKAGLNPPETWSDYQVLLEKLGSWAPGLKAVEPWSPEFRATMFLARAVPYVKHSGHYSVFFDIESGTPTIASPGFEKALEATQAAVKLLSPDVFQYDPVTCRNLILSGQAAMAIGLETGPNSAPLIGGAAVPQRDAKTPATVRAEGISIGFCRLPGNPEVYNPTLKTWVVEEQSAINYVTFTGFSGLCAAVPRGVTPAQSTAALNLLSSLMLDSGSTFPANSRSLCRESQAPEAGNWVGKALSASEAGKYVGVAAKSLRDRQQVSELPVVGHSEFRAALTTGLKAALQDGQPAKTALNGIAEEWQQILQKIGPEKVRASYRSALGLSKLEEL